MKQISSDVGNVNIDGVPNRCPFCHKSITPNVLYGHRRENTLEVLMYCPDSYCKAAFIGYYDLHTGSQYFMNGRTSRGTIFGRDFSDKIREISPAFVMIYNQAYAAEQENLTEICGVGFRKALEFLIKNYTILNNTDKQELIEKKFLGTVIDEFVNDARIKTVAKRAVWLGNDETHYIRKWEGKNLEDLKKLIDLTLHWIEMEALTKSFESEMPE